MILRALYFHFHAEHFFSCDVKFTPGGLADRYFKKESHSTWECTEKHINIL